MKIKSKRAKLLEPPPRVWPFPTGHIIHEEEDEPPEDWMDDFTDDEVIRKTTEGVIVDHNWIQTDDD